MRLLPVLVLLCVAVVVESYFLDDLFHGRNHLTTTTGRPTKKHGHGSSSSSEKKGQGHKKGHGNGKGKGKGDSSDSTDSSGDSSESHEKKRSSPRSSPRTPTVSSRQPSSRRSTSPTPPTRETRATRLTTTAGSITTGTTSSSVSKPACAQSIFPITRPRTETNFTYNPDIVFEVFQNETGCDFLRISCSGYSSAFISAQWGNGGDVIFPDPVTSTDSTTLVTATYTLPWEEFGWGADTPDKVILDNAFYCFVGSLEPVEQAADGPSCKCKYDSVWVDLMIILDASDSSGDQGLQQMFGYVQTSLSWFNIQNTSYSDPYHTRVGIITYASKATLLAPLGSITGEYLENMGRLPYSDEESSNISAALELAEAQFEGPARRKNVKQVIALFATSFNYQSDPALDVSRFFKEDGGTLFVYDYIESMGISSNALSWLATPGYFYTELTDNGGKALMKSLCDVNCYCPDDWASFKNSNDTGIPTAGCYYPTVAQANFRLATSRCTLFRNGSILALGKTAEKTKFLWSLVNFSPLQFWAGIKWTDLEEAYFWLDGTPVEMDLYQPWDGGHQQGMDCVAVINENWVPVDCRLGYYYVCEAVPCDSEHYCLDEV